MQLHFACNDPAFDRDANTAVFLARQMLIIRPIGLGKKKRKVLPKRVFLLSLNGGSFVGVDLQTEKQYANGSVEGHYMQIIDGSILYILHCACFVYYSACMCVLFVRPGVLETILHG